MNRLNSGVYAIICHENGKHYIGSSVRICERWSQHKTDLRGGYHTNIHLQNAWNKYGESRFEFVIVEFVPASRNDLLSAEQRWMDATSPEFNLTIKAESPMLGKKMSDEHKRKISRALKGRESNRKGSHMPEDARRKISKALVGNVFRRGKKASKKTRESCSAAQKARHSKYPISAATREKLRDARMGKKHSAETIEKIRQKALERGRKREENGQKQQEN